MIFDANVFSFGTKFGSISKFHTALVVFIDNRMGNGVSNNQLGYGKKILKKIPLRAISVWSLEDRRTGQEAKVMTKRDLMEMGLEERDGDQSPAKSAST